MFSSPRVPFDKQLRSSSFELGRRCVVRLPNRSSDELEKIFILARWEGSSTYDHRSVKTGHPVRNHRLSIMFVVSMKILEKKVL
jgi:hypothetical protein